jgi:hypothetical protein
MLVLKTLGHGLRLLRLDLFGRGVGWIADFADQATSRTAVI